MSEKVGEAVGFSNMVVRNFQPEREDFFICCNCESHTRGRHTDMSMWCHNRTSSVSLQQLLEQSLAKEERELRYDECGCETATATSSLIIYLKRYKYNMQDLAPIGMVSKVVVVVDIPDTVCLTSLVGGTVALPSSFLPALAPHHTQEVALCPQSPPATPAKNRDALDTPVKFKRLKDAEVSTMSEDDQMEYLMHISKNEALFSSGQDQLARLLWRPA